MSAPREGETVPEYVARLTRGHYTPKPDPLTVTGRLRWEDVKHGWNNTEVELYVGTVLLGSVWSQRDGQWRITSPSVREIVFYPTAISARAALVQAVKEAIGG